MAGVDLPEVLAHGRHPGNFAGYLSPTRTWPTRSASHDPDGSIYSSPSIAWPGHHLHLRTLAEGTRIISLALSVGVRLVILLAERR